MRRAGGRAIVLSESLYQPGEKRCESEIGNRHQVWVRFSGSCCTIYIAKCRIKQSTFKSLMVIKKVCQVFFYKPGWYLYSACPQLY